MRLSTKYEYFFDKSNVDNCINLKKNKRTEVSVQAVSSGGFRGNSIEKTVRIGGKKNKKKKNKKKKKKS